MYIRSGQAFVLMYSITDRNSFEEVNRLLEQVMRVKDYDSEKSLVAALVGNKCDLEEDREVSTSEGKAFASAHSLLFLECSAKTNINIDTIFTSLALLHPSQSFLEKSNFVLLEAFMLLP